MPSIFNDCDGGVLRIEGKCKSTGVAAIKVDTFNINVPITGFTLDLGTNHQFLHTLDEFIYLYAFGDRIGELVLSGVAFAGTCVVNDAGEAWKNRLAPDWVLSYYMNNRVARNGGPKPAKITISNTSKLLIGFLTGMRLDLPNPAMPVVQWALRYNVVVAKKPPAPLVDPAGGTRPRPERPRIPEY